MSIVPPVNSSPAPSASSTPPSSSGAAPNSALNFTQNFDTFLTLLTTQLKNQDPLSPMDTSQFTSQLVAFSQVEQQIRTNSNLQTMIAGQSAGEAISALPMVGRTIEYSGNQTVLHNGQASFSYTLPTNATAASIAVTDVSGKTVFSADVDPSAGKHAFTWPGQTNTGARLPDGGTYTLKVQAAGANNAAIAATTTATGIVSSVSVNNNVASFDISGVQVPMSQLVNVVPDSATASN